MIFVVCECYTFEFLRRSILPLFAVCPAIFVIVTSNRMEGATVKALVSLMSE